MFEWFPFVKIIFLCCCKWSLVNYVSLSCSLSALIVKKKTYYTDVCHRHLSVSLYGWVHFPRCFEIISLSLLYMVWQAKKKIDLFIYWRLNAPSTQQGHFRAFHLIKYYTKVEYSTKYAHFTNVKYIHIIRKLVPSGIALVKNGEWIWDMLVTLAVSVWRFNTRLKKYLKKWSKTIANYTYYTNVYKLIPVPYGSVCCTYHQLKYSSPNRSNKQKRQEPHKIGKWRFRGKEINRMR